ncbi:AMP-binding protein [Nocardiopsis kunsanensis]|uniref:Uncharacterized protein n=1 Tax=Nocardiopsis kunsanensis TaxID=141693 RepID=A0A919CLW2_9ACTN|nr:AMP-binding protein [Nocardiopsis kunsanensis]GHD35706.1 hypothetical protein GCM10007147_42400 [Nocardiopsis kunsanensis]
MNIVDLLRHRAEQGLWSEAPAFVEEDRDFSLTHAQVLDCAEHLANTLRQAGVRSQEPVALLVGDRLEWPVGFLACARLGALAVLVNPEASPPTLDELYRLGKVSTLLTWSEGTVSLVDRESGETRAAWRLADALEAPRPEPTPDTGAQGQDLEDVPLYLQFSSGTTGLHKGVVHRSVDLPVYYHTVGGTALALAPGDLLYSVSQFYFTYGFNNQFVYPMFSGCAAVLRPARRSAEDVAVGLGQFSPTILFSVPSNLASVPSLVSARAVRSFPLRAVVSAGERLSASVENDVTDVLGVPVFEQIGCTEHGNAVCANGFHAHSPFSTGFPCDGTAVEIREAKSPEAARAASPGEQDVGDLWVRSPTIPTWAHTVHGAVRLTDESGWLRTGDLAYWNEDRALVVVGRSDDILMNGGISVSAVRVEQCIRASGLVEDTALTSLIGPEGKSYLAALIVVGKEQESALADVERRLIAYCREHLDRFCVPKRFLAGETVPRTPSGKIRRHLVAEAAGELLESSGKGAPSDE